MPNRRAMPPVPARATRQTRTTIGCSDSFPDSVRPPAGGAKFPRFVARNQRLDANHGRRRTARFIIEQTVDMFQTKSLDRILAESEKRNALKRTLGPGALVSLGVGAVIG